MSRRCRAATALAVCAALTGCGSSTPAPRAQVARYITQVNRIAAAGTSSVTTVTQVSGEVASRGGQTLTAAVGRQRQLAAAAEVLRAQEARLRRLAAPAPAAHLRSLLLKLTGNEAALTHQLGLLVGFLPRFSAAMAPLTPALTRLEAALSVRQAAGTAAVSAVYAAKTQALRRFQAATGRILVRLRRLTPPAASRPSYQAQLQSLQGMRTAAGRLAAALGGGAAGDVTPLLVAFDRAALRTRSRSVQRAEIAAARAYDRQVRDLNALSEQISAERYRLAVKLH